jgi:2,3-bisphosphoglycerate-independent phosphoglycerate mutase
VIVDESGNAVGPIVDGDAVAIRGPGLHPGVKFRTDIKVPGLANVAATVMNLHGFEAPSDYEATLIEVADN